MQGKWLYLEPIFSSEEIMKQIPKEGSAFRQMDATWRNIMTAVKQKPLIVDVYPQSAARSATDCVEHLILAASARCCLLDGS